MEERYQYYCNASVIAVCFSSYSSNLDSADLRKPNKICVIGNLSLETGSIFVKVVLIFALKTRTDTRKGNSI